MTPSTDRQRPLELDPARVVRSEKPHYAIIDIGSNSVRLVVYDQLSRAPLPRFNEKSLCRLAEGLSRSGAILPEGFRCAIEAVRRFRAIADAMGVGRLDVTGTEAIRNASNGPALAADIRTKTGLEVRILTGAEEARYAALGVISGFFRPVGLVGDMGGGSLELAEAIDDHVGEIWVSLPLGALPVEAMLADGLAAAKRRVDEMLKSGLPAQVRTADVLCGRRRLASARQGAHGQRRRAGQSRSRLYALGVRGARLRPVGVPAHRGEGGFGSRRRLAPGAHLAGRRAGHGSCAEASRARKSGVLGFRPARRPALFAARRQRSNTATHWSKARS